MYGAATDYSSRPIAIILRGLPRTVDLSFAPNASGGDGTDIGAFEIQAPTAAPVFVSGRVRTPDGRGLRGEIVMLTDENGVMRMAVTNGFGYYRFDRVGVGQSYVLGVASKRYRFIPQLIFVTGDFAGLDLYPEP